jgi:hypothetical protein
VKLILKYTLGLFTFLFMFRNATFNGSRNIIWAVFHGELHHLRHAVTETSN